MPEPASFDKLLDLLIDALEERKARRDQNGTAVSPETQLNQPITSSETPYTIPPINVDKQPTVVAVKERVKPESAVSIKERIESEFVASDSLTHTPVPKSWKKWSAKQKVFLVEDLTPELVTKVSRFNKPLLGDLTPTMLRVMPKEALKKLPPQFVWELPKERRQIVVARLRGDTLPDIKRVEITELDDGGVVSAETTEKQANDEPTKQKTTSAAAESPPVDPPSQLKDTSDVQNIEPVDLIQEQEQEAEEETAEAEITIHATRPIVSDNMPRTLTQVLAALLVFIVIANIRLDTSMLGPLVGSSSANGQTRIAVASDGMLISGIGREVYLIEQGKRRWITTPEAFESLGYQWRMVRTVSNDYLNEFELGEPINILLKCPGSRHVFVYSSKEGGTQRLRHYIPNIKTFNALGYQWSDISEAHCRQLGSAANGDPMLEGYDGPIPNPNSR